MDLLLVYGCCVELMWVWLMILSYRSVCNVLVMSECVSVEWCQKQSRDMFEEVFAESDEIISTFKQSHLLSLSNYPPLLLSLLLPFLFFPQNVYSSICYTHNHKHTQDTRTAFTLLF